MSDEKNMIANIIFFKEILKHACLSFDLVPNLIHTTFQTSKQQFVLRCETKVGADD